VLPEEWRYLQTIHPDEAAERGTLLGKLFDEFAADEAIDLAQVHRVVIREIGARARAGHDERLDREVRDPARKAALRARRHLALAAAALRELVRLTKVPDQMSDDDLIDQRGLLTLFLDPPSEAVLAKFGLRRPESRRGRPEAQWRPVDAALKRAGVSTNDRWELLYLLGLRDM
jgi:hypothetical protein